MEDVILSMIGYNLLIIAFCGILIYHVFVKKHKMTKVNEEGIRVKVDNRFLIDNYVAYYTKKYGEEKAKELDLKSIAIEDYIEMFKENSVDIKEYNENEMLISWEYLDSWERKMHKSRYSIINTENKGDTLNYVEAKIKNMETPLKVHMLPFSDKMSYFKNQATDKKTKNPDQVVSVYIIVIIVCALIGIFAMLMQKDVDEKKNFYDSIKNNTSSTEVNIKN